MTKIAFSKNGSSPFQQLLGHNDSILKNWTSLEECFYQSHTFTAELKEEVRRTLAFNNGCQYCMARGKPSEKIADLKISMAVEIADKISKRQPIDKFDKLKKEFKEEEIAELLAFICFTTASQTFGAILELQPSCSII
ncbi:carboxymuconolactone decarboxylase family protein [Aminipila sp.]|uniref:carboxymuconolactone decarboxylase family protein n=1 Tax=Aminipila sp. TaxID=2060095 RepID=UPI00289B17DF|nr:carboxymuconolactone decarboxylase family protein [Aminipila sp.]